MRASNRWAAWPQPHSLLIWEARAEPSMAGCDVQAPERRSQSQSGDAWVHPLGDAGCSVYLCCTGGQGGGLSPVGQWRREAGHHPTRPEHPPCLGPTLLPAGEQALPCSQLVVVSAGVSRGRQGGVELDLAAGLAEEGGVSECGTLSRAEDSGRPGLPRWEGNQAASVARAVGWLGTCEKGSLWDTLVSWGGGHRAWGSCAQ